MDTSATQPRTFKLPERVAIARRLKAFGLEHIRLPGITTGPICMGYANACHCAECTADPKAADAQPAQPWEPRASKRAA